MSWAVGVHNEVLSGPLIVAVPIAAAAGAITFLSPCCLPLIPGYLSYVTGMSGSDAALEATEESGHSRGRTVAGAALVVLGFSVLFAAYGAAFGGLGELLLTHQRGLLQVFGVVTIALGLLFAGVFDRFMFAGRILRPSVRPRAGLAGAPLLGVLFGLGWTPCTGPTLGAVLTLATTTGTATRGAFLLFVYGLGLGVPFLIMAVLFQRGMTGFGFARRHAGLVMRFGGGLLVVVGLLQVTGAWSAVMIWMKVHWVASYSSPI